MRNETVNLLHGFCYATALGLIVAAYHKPLLAIVGDIRAWYAAQPRAITEPGKLWDDVREAVNNAG